jgi:hypothetical protein
LVKLPRIKTPTNILKILLCFFFLFSFFFPFFFFFFLLFSLFSFGSSPLPSRCFDLVAFAVMVVVWLLLRVQWGFGGLLLLLLFQNCLDFCFLVSLVFLIPFLVTACGVAFGFRWCLDATLGNRFSKELGPEFQVPQVQLEPELVEPPELLEPELVEPPELLEPELVEPPEPPEREFQVRLEQQEKKSVEPLVQLVLELVEPLELQEQEFLEPPELLEPEVQVPQVQLEPLVGSTCIED